MPDEFFDPMGFLTLHEVFANHNGQVLFFFRGARFFAGGLRVGVF
jgi:hypothetical protein